jgi:hypothetical protein
LTPQNQTPQIFRLAVKDVVALRIEHHPCTGRKLVVELTASPPGIPAEHPHPSDFICHIDRIAGQIDAAQIRQDRAPGVFARSA